MLIAFANGSHCHPNYKRLGNVDFLGEKPQEEEEEGFLCIKKLLTDSSFLQIPKIYSTVLIQKIHYLVLSGEKFGSKSGFKEICIPLHPGLDGAVCHPTIYELKGQFVCSFHRYLHCHHGGIWIEQLQ